MGNKTEIETEIETRNGREMGSETDLETRNGRKLETRQNKTPNFSTKHEKNREKD